MGISTIQILAPLYFTHLSRNYGDSLGNFGEPKSESEYAAQRLLLANDVGSEIS